MGKFIEEFFYANFLAIDMLIDAIYRPNAPLIEQGEEKLQQHVYVLAYAAAAHDRRVSLCTMVRLGYSCILCLRCMLVYRSLIIVYLSQPVPNFRIVSP